MLVRMFDFDFNGQQISVMADEDNDPHGEITRLLSKNAEESMRFVDICREVISEELAAGRDPFLRDDDSAFWFVTA